MKFFLSFLSLAALITLVSCQQTEEPTTINPYHDAYTEASKYLNLPEKSNSYAVEFPTYLRNNGFFSPTVDDDKATLGRVLFYDKNLSKTDEVSCASCHEQELAFGDGKKVSDGVSGRHTTRNSIALGSTVNFGAYYGDQSFFNINFFWDDRAKSVAEQSRGSLSSPLEMDMDMETLVQRVKENDKYYKWLFMEAYPSGVTEDNILDALQHFVNSMGSYHSPFDEGMNTNSGNEYATFAELSAEQNTGKAIFMDNCSPCHSKFAARSSIPMANNGLALDYADNGKSLLTGSVSDKGVFKVPSLRNVALTAPYMHDGSIATLEEVVEHYSTGIKDHQNLDPNLKENGHAKHLNLSDSDKAALVAFLHAFNDPSILVDERYSDPFK